MSSNTRRQWSEGTNQSTRPTQRNNESSQPPSAPRHNAGPSGYVGFGGYGTSEPAPSHSNRRPSPSDPYGSTRTSELAAPSQSNRWLNPPGSHRTGESAPAQSNEGSSRYASYEYPPPPHPPPSAPSNGTRQPTRFGSNSESYYAGRSVEVGRSPENELEDATAAIERDPSDYRGYERRYAILHSMGRHTEAFDAFDKMISRIEQSRDPQIRILRNRYVDATLEIRKAIEETIRDIPRVLIDVTTGRLCGKKLQAAIFEKQPIFDELRSSMTTHDQLDREQIREKVEAFYDYVMFSHKWQPPEPTFQMVRNIRIYDLPRSPSNNKLVTFCHLVHSHHFRWAWSDTCCVDQADKSVQQEAIFSMFKWYCRAALTIVHLLGVLSGSQRNGSLSESIWNTRGWTYQEYVASKAVRFYTEDWKPYRGLDIFNHKNSPFIRSEMEHATRFDQLATLQPGLEMVREKLYLASKRRTTREEDIAYSLFGIFRVAIPIMYGEGNQAVGRLLAYILTRSANVTILAWTGMSGSYHSCLPADLTVYNQIYPRHAPQPIEAAAMDRMVMELQSSIPDRSLAVRLYERLQSLPSLSLVSGRLKLPGLVFRLTHVVHLPKHESDSTLHVYCAMAPILGDVRIETKDNSLEMQHLVLVHPWISTLLDEDFSGDLPRFGLNARAFRLMVRLRRPFGALLLAPQGRVQYKRVATDSFIKVQIRAETPLEELMSRIQTVDVQ